jgi:putative transposase
VSLEEHKRRERAQAIGLFRYQLICPALDAGLSTKQRGKLVRQLAAQTHHDPFGNQVRVSRETLDRWIRRYRAGGFEALVPEPRRLAARTDAQVLELAASLKRENPTRTATQVARILRTATGWAPSESTLLRHFHRCELMGPGAGEVPAVFGRFEAADPNELWVGDALHGPRVGDRKTYLFAFLDDHSRLATGYRFGFSEDTVRLAAALRPALAARGVPGGIYVDNGSAFVDAWLLRACAKLGVRLVHSAPGRPQGRARSNGFSAPCANSSSSRSPTPARTSLPPAWITPPHCWSSTGCLWPGPKPNTTAGPTPKPGKARWPAGTPASSGSGGPQPCRPPMS